MSQQNCEFSGLSALADAPSSPELSSKIKEAKAAGVSFISILLALATHAGDIKAIVSAIVDLINKVKPAPTPTTPGQP